MTRTDLPQLYIRLGLTPIPLKPRSKEPLVKWRNGWTPTLTELKRWAAKLGINWAVRCGAELAALDFDTEDSFRNFLRAHPEAASWPRVKTGRGYHIWIKPRRAVSTQRFNDLEVKCVGSYIVAPPSIHPSGSPYRFEVTPDGTLPEVDLVKLLGLGQIDSLPAQTLESLRQAAPSDFALSYGKSPYPRSMCGRATKVLTRSDGKVKQLLSLRDWKWDCPKCAPLLKRYWLEKLNGLRFRFMLRLPSVAKPTAFLRRVGQPGYAHIVANGESWLFLLSGQTELVCAEARKAGYALVAGDIAGDPGPDEIRGCLEQALCREDEPLNTRRKITHSKGLLRKAAQRDKPNESNLQADCGEEKEMVAIKTILSKEPLAWESEVIMEPIEEVAKELERQGWHILWRSDVEAMAVKGKALAEDVDIVELMGMLGVKLKKAGKEYIGLCPFHEDHSPSLAVNREKGVWKCHSSHCGKGGNAQQFLKEWQARKGL